MKNKKIAIDSGIVLDSNKVKQTWLLKNLGLKFGLWQVNKTELEPIIGPETYEKMRQEIFTKESIVSHPITEDVEEFFRIFKDNEIYMLTVKTPNYIPYLTEWLYLHKKSFPNPPQILTTHGIIVEWSHLHKKSPKAIYNKAKAEICRKYRINIIIDDDIRHLREMPPSIERIFFKPKQPPENLSDIIQIGSWKEIVSYLDKKYKD